MQVMPPTGKGTERGRHHQVDNIHAGVKYMRFMMDEYKDEPMDNLNKLMTFAAYNAGPGRVTTQARTEKRGLIPMCGSACRTHRSGSAGEVTYGNIYDTSPSYH
jgi:membrane-bound lytic murein transglycosylase MltF